MSVSSYLRRALANGLEIHNVYDIGACMGAWTQEYKSSVLCNSKFYLFEANPAYKEVLEKQESFVHMGVLSNPGRDTVKFYAGTDTGDSYYQETTDHYEKKVPVELPCRTLDSIIEESNLPIPQLVKIDTQGSELDILSGAKKIMGETDLIYLECPIIEYNRGAPSILDYLSFMNSYRYIPTEILEIHKSEEVVLQIDIMFIKSETKDKLFGKNVHIRPFSSI